MKKLTLFLWLVCLGAISLMAQSRLKVSILGDSYSTFKGYVEPDTNAVWYSENTDRNDVVKVEQTWWYQFVRNYGYVLEKNNSFSGSTICHTGYRKEDYSDRSFITRMDKLGNPDIILVFGATNDSWAGAPIGEYKYADWTRQELYSFRPALAYLLHGLDSLYPEARVYYILNSELKPSIDESVYTVCAHYGVPVIQLYDIDKQRSHPSIAGMKSISMQIHHYLEREADRQQLQEIKQELQELKQELRELKK